MIQALLRCAVLGVPILLVPLLAAPTTRSLPPAIAAKNPVKRIPADSVSTMVFTDPITAKGKTARQMVLITHDATPFTIQVPGAVPAP